MTDFRKEFGESLVRSYHNVLLLEETKKKYSRTTTSFRGRNAMEFLYDSENGVKMSELADYLRISRPSCTSLVKKLEDLDYVERTSSADDARSELVSLTRRGRLVTVYQTTHRNAMMDEIMSEFSQKELEIIKRGFDRMNEVFENCAVTLEETYSAKNAKKIKRIQKNFASNQK